MEKSRMKLRIPQKNLMPGRQGWGWPWLLSSLSRLFFPLLIFSHYILYHQSPTPPVLCCSPFSSHSLQISHNAVLPSHSLSSSSIFPLHFLGIWSLCQFLISHSLYSPANFSLLLTIFLKLSFTPTFTLRSSILLFSALFTPMILII